MQRTLFSVDLVQLIFKGENYLGDCVKKKTKTQTHQLWLVFRHLKTLSFKLGVIIETFEL